MHLYPVLNSFYASGSLWGALMGSQVCPSRSAIVSQAAYAAAWPSTPGTVAEVTAFIDVNVVPMDTERVLMNHTVVIAGDRIIGLGPSGGVKVPAQATRIDGRGKYLIPGLTEMHTHFQTFHGKDALVHDMFRYLAHGVTTVRNLNDVTSDILRDAHVEEPTAGWPAWFQWLKTAEVVSPRLYYPVPPRLLDSLMAALPPEKVGAKIAAALTAYRAAGYDYIDLPLQARRGDGTAFDSLWVVAAQLGVSLSSHKNGRLFAEIPRVGALGGSVEHLRAFVDTLSKPGAEIADAELREMAAKVQRTGVWITPTLNCIPKLQPMSVGLVRRLTKALQDAGVKLLLGSDAAGGPGETPAMINEELMQMVRAGLSPYQALVTGTRHAAEFFKILDSSGTVAVGKRADLVLLRGNPLADIRHVREPVGVMIRGRWLDRTRLDQGLLASPREWARVELGDAARPSQDFETGRSMGHSGKHIKQAQQLWTDSLAALAPSDREAQVRVRQWVAAELAAARAKLAPEQYETFDPMARVWLREQARQGYSVTVPGITVE